MEAARPDFVESLDRGANSQLLRQQHDTRTMLTFRKISKESREMSWHRVNVVSEQDTIKLFCGGKQFGI